MGWILEIHGHNSHDRGSFGNCMSFHTTFGIVDVSFCSSSSCADSGDTSTVPIIYHKMIVDLFGHLHPPKNNRGSRGGSFGHFLERCSLAQIARKHTKSQRNSFYCHAVGNVFFLFSSVGEFRVKEEDASAVLDTVNHCHCIVSCFLRHFCRLYQCLSLYRGQPVKSLLYLVHQHQHSISSPLDN